MSKEAEEITDAPVEGSSFIRHYSESFERVESLEPTQMTSMIDPHIGWYKTTVQTHMFPYLTMKNPVDPKLNYSDTVLFNMISNYEDVLYCRRHPDNETIRTVYCAHALNHSLKTNQLFNRSRKLIVKNNERELKSGVSDSFRDQGFHRARTLILAPTREAARRIVHTFLTLMPKGSTVCHRQRFERDFGPQPGETDEEKRKGRKPKDYEDWFSCNTNDHFRIGIAFAKKSLKLYSAFADSDLILASPLGLQTIIDEEKEKEADLQYITASTELLIIDQAEMLLMQNWSNVQRIVSMLNQRPTKANFTSATRIRLAYLAGYGRCYRQTLIFSAVAAPQISLLTGDCENFQGLNYIPPQPQFPGLYPSYLPDVFRVPGLKPLSKGRGGKSKGSNAKNSPMDVGDDDDQTLLMGEIKLNLISFAVTGQIQAISNTSDNEDMDEGEKKVKLKNGTPVGDRKQVLLSCDRIDQADHTYLAGRAVPLARMNAFKTRILPRLRRGLDARVLVYVPDFYDLEELRMLLTAESLDFCCVHEYTEDTEAERFRTLFGDGRIRILLMSERYYFFRRRKIPGATTFIFFGPPTFPWFVTELMEMGQSAVVAAATNGSNLPTPRQLTLLYYPPYESNLISTITGKIDL